MPKPERVYDVPVSKIVLVLSSIALLAFLGLWVEATFLAPMDASMRVTDLDRAEVINEAKLRESFPHLAKNTRRDLGRWIARAGLDNASLSSGLGAVFAFICFVTSSAGLLGRRRDPVEEEPS